MLLLQRTLNQVKRKYLLFRSLEGLVGYPSESIFQISCLCSKSVDLDLLRQASPDNYEIIAKRQKCCLGDCKEIGEFLHTVCGKWLCKKCIIGYCFVIIFQGHEHSIE